jgi:adenylate kinase family enzyme
MSSHPPGAPPMRKIAVFGNAGAGKSRLARQLAEATGIPLYCLDKLQFRAGRYWPQETDGGKIPDDDYLKIHAEIIERDEWIIDGFGSMALAWQRFAAADTLVYIDLPLMTHYRWVTRRFAAGIFKAPLGWPENSPLWTSTWHSYRNVWRCHRWLTPKYRQLVADARSHKRVHHLKSAREIAACLRTVKQEHQCWEAPTNRFSGLSGRNSGPDSRN